MAEAVATESAGGSAGAIRPSVKHLLLPPRVLANGMEVAICSCPRALRVDLMQVLPGVPIDDIFILPCCQRASLDLLSVGADVAAEKDRLLELFVVFAKEVKGRLSSYWVDFVDPCSGLPVNTRNVSVIYPEADTIQLLLRYRTESAGPCKVLMHPRWGSHVYPATLFAIAPFDALVAACEGAAKSICESGSAALAEAGTGAT